MDRWDISVSVLFSNTLSIMCISTGIYRGYRDIVTRPQKHLGILDHNTDKMPRIHVFKLCLSVGFKGVIELTNSYATEPPAL